MPIPSASEYTRFIRILANASAQKTATSASGSYVIPVSAITSSFLPRATSATPPAPPTYAIIPSATVIGEGESVIFSVKTTNVPNGTVLYWTTSGTASASKFVDNTDIGSFTIQSGTGTIVRTIKTDLVVDADQTFVLSVRLDSGEIVATSEVVTVQDRTPTYTIEPSVTVVDEGSSVVFTLTTTNVPNGTVLYWTNMGTTVAEDFTDTANSGSVSVIDGSATITRSLLLDDIASELETVVLQLTTESGTVVATSGTVTVVDKTAIYAVSANTSAVNEGQSVTFTITTTNVEDGTTLYWTTDTGADFTDNAASGSFTITANTGTIVRTLKNDTTTEGTETFVLSIRTVSASGTVVATSSAITVNDTSFGATFTWVQQTAATTLEWKDMDMSSDGNTVIVTNSRYLNNSGTWQLHGVFVSTDGGTSFTQRIPQWDGRRVIGVALARALPTTMYCVYEDDLNVLKKSTDGGVTWVTIGPDRGGIRWADISCSANGQIVLATNAGSGSGLQYDRVSYSTNGGTTWTRANASFTGSWTHTAMSSDGTIMFAIRSDTRTVWRSTNTGATWTQVFSSFPDTSNSYPIRCSADGQIVLFGQQNGGPYISTDGGTTWTVSSAPSAGRPGTYGLAVSDDGNTILATGWGGGGVAISVDRGATWATDATLSTSSIWGAIATNSNGRKAVVGVWASSVPYKGTR